MCISMKYVAQYFSRRGVLIWADVRNDRDLESAKANMPDGAMSVVIMEVGGGAKGAEAGHCGHWAAEQAEAPYEYLASSFGYCRDCGAWSCYLSGLQTCAPCVTKWIKGR